jgi:iron complex transport system substrate-binding protein
MEEFYATAKDADFIIYNSTIDGEISSLDELIAKNSLLADFKAVKNGTSGAPVKICIRKQLSLA